MLLQSEMYLQAKEDIEKRQKLELERSNLEFNSLQVDMSVVISSMPSLCLKRKAFLVSLRSTTLSNSVAWLKGIQARHTALILRFSRCGVT